jgi:pyruvate kinase
MVLRRTKIIATLGPATDDVQVLERMIIAGLDIVRANFSHGDVASHERRIKTVRQLAAAHGREIGVLADLQGPKIRIARFKEGKVILKEGAAFILDADLATDQGTENSVGIDYKQLPRDVMVGDKLLLDDGRLVFAVESVKNAEIHCRVEVGGELSNNKGINRQGGGLSADALTDKDKQDLKAAIALGVDFIAISFVRNAEDVLQARELIKQAGGSAAIVAKIERTEAIEEINNIIQAADAVMVARGDLGVEIGDAELPGVQKHIIHQARVLDKAVITATQMMESMIHSPIPTRAEVFDVANAVLDGTDAVMLSAETATGDHPDKVIEAVVRICLGAEKQPRAQISKHRVECRFEHIDEAIAMATMYTANHLGIKAIIALTESGSTPLWMSRIRSGIPIYGLSRHIGTQRKMNLYRGVYPINFDVTLNHPEKVNQQAVAELERRGIVQKGDLLIITRGDLVGVHGKTNSMKIIQVGAVA